MTTIPPVQTVNTAAGSCADAEPPATPRMAHDHEVRVIERIDLAMRGRELSANIRATCLKLAIEGADWIENDNEAVRFSVEGVIAVARKFEAYVNGDDA